MPSGRSSESQRRWAGLSGGVAAKTGAMKRVAASAAAARFRRAELICIRLKLSDSQGGNVNRKFLFETVALLLRSGIMGAVWCHPSLHMTNRTKPTHRCLPVTGLLFSASLL